MTTVSTWPAGELNPKVKAGDIVNKYDCKFRWTSNHYTGQEMLHMTNQADPLADGAIPFLKGRGILAIEDLITQEDCPVQVKSLHDQITQVPDWVSVEQIKRGQEFYWSTFHDNGRVLMNYSLISDFSVSSIVRVLTCTGNLTNPKSAYRRGVETAYMVSSAMRRGQLLPWGRGWRDVVAVRLMHAQARVHATRISKRTNKPLMGAAINQQDLMFTLLLFSVTVILGYDKLGVKYTAQQRDDYLAVFRYIGYIIGVEDPLDCLANFSTSLSLKQSLDMYMIQPNMESARITSMVFKSFEKSPPYFLPFRHHIQIARLLMGESLANELLLPYANTGLDFSLKAGMFYQNFTLDLLLMLNREWTLSFLEQKVLESYRAILKGVPTFTFIGFQEDLDYSVQLKASNHIYYFMFIISQLGMTNTSSNTNTGQQSRKNTASAEAAVTAAIATNPAALSAALICLLQGDK